MGASYALVDDPEARDYRRFQQTRAGGTKNPYKLPPPADNFTHSPPPVNTPQPRIESYVPPEPKGTTTSPNAESALPDATPTPADAIIDVQPSELPDLPSSRTRSKTKTIESVGATLIAAALRDTSSERIVVLFDEKVSNVRRDLPRPRGVRMVMSASTMRRVGRGKQLGVGEDVAAR